MAAKKKKEPQLELDPTDDIAKALIKDLNKEFGTRIAYNLAEASAPTIVKHWIGTGSLMLNYAIANKRGGGYPGGRIIEVSGLASTGKSHLAYEAARTVQRLGGLVIYVDTENATPVDKLGSMGIDVKKRFVYVDTHCTEEVLTVIDSIIRKAKSVSGNIPILAIWDSVAATAPKAELEGEYDQNTVGLQARTLSKGMRKIVGVLGEHGVTLLCINQLRTKIGVNFGDPYVTPGGAAIPFHSSVRVRLTGEGSPVKDKFGNVIGIRVPLKIMKNKVGPPFRNFSIEIHFGKGIVETDALIDVGIEYCVKHGSVRRDGKLLSMTGKGKPWKTFMVTTEDGEVLLEKKFQKDSFDSLLYNEPGVSDLMLEFYDGVLTVVYGDADVAEEDLNPETDEEDMGEEENVKATKEVEDAAEL